MKLLIALIVLGTSINALAVDCEINSKTGHEITDFAYKLKDTFYLGDITFADEFKAPYNIQIQDGYNSLAVRFMDYEHNQLYSFGVNLKPDLSVSSIDFWYKAPLNAWIGSFYPHDWKAMTGFQPGSEADYACKPMIDDMLRLMGIARQ